MYMFKSNRKGAYSQNFLQHILHHPNTHTHTHAQWTVHSYTGSSPSTGGVGCRCTAPEDHLPGTLSQSRQPKQAFYLQGLIKLIELACCGFWTQIRLACYYCVIRVPCYSNSRLLLAASLAPFLSLCFSLPENTEAFHTFIYNLYLLDTWHSFSVTNKTWGIPVKATPMLKIWFIDLEYHMVLIAPSRQAWLPTIWLIQWSTECFSFSSVLKTWTELKVGRWNLFL